MVEREEDIAGRPTPAIDQAGTDAKAIRAVETAIEETEVERAMAVGREVMSDHHAVLAALAK